jgi:ABC-type sugar transport system ATPase subunit
MPPALQLRSITKSFPGVVAVKSLDFDLTPGKIHSLVGVNGSGKSTTVKIIAGVYPPDKGDYYVRGEKVRLKSPVEAKNKGIITVFQERQIFPDLSIAENIFLNELDSNPLKPINWRTAIRESQRMVASFGMDFDCSRPISRYGVGIQQIVEIIRGMIHKPDVLILDEPTSSLSRGEVEKLFRFMRDLRRHNVSILFIAHNIDEVLEISDEITVLRDGMKAAYEQDASKVEKKILIRSMLGEDIDFFFGQDSGEQDTATAHLSIQGLPVETWNTRVSFDLKRGEVLSIAGLVGSGASEIAMKLGGAIPSGNGYIWKNGEPVQFYSTRQALNSGVAYLPQDRMRYGLFMNLNNTENIVSSILRKVSKRNIFRRKIADTIAYGMIRETNVTPPDPNFYTQKLSGGNQQKVLFARILATNPEIIVLENPTVGVDVGSQFELHKLIRKKAASGVSVLLVSSDYREVAAVSDRVIIIREGVLACELKNPPFTESNILFLVGANRSQEADQNEGR